MGILDALAESAAGGLLSKAKEEFQNITGPAKDADLESHIRTELLAQYGNETFYESLDAFLSERNTVSHLIATIRGAAAGQVQGQSEFVEQTAEAFWKSYPNCHVQRTQILSIFNQIFCDVVNFITRANPYSTAGQQNSLLATSNAEEAHHLQRIESKVDLVFSQLQSLSAIAPSQPPDCTAAAAAFQAQIEHIVSEYQSKGQFEAALVQYSELSLSILQAEVHGESKNNLICSLCCNIALCHSNLGNLNDALNALDQVPDTIAQSSAEYCFTRAAILVQHNCDRQYSEALDYAERALALKSNHYRAYFLLQYLRALTGSESQDKVIADLTANFLSIPEGNQRDNLAPEYYTYQGLICSVFHDSHGAFENYELAKQHGYDDLIARFNILSALYGQAVENAQRDQRILQPNVDTKKLCRVLGGLQELLRDDRLNLKSYREVKCQTVRLYVATSSVIKGTHDLKPIEAYLPFVQDYEAIRILILGSEEPLSPDVIARLNKNDQFFLHIRQLFEEGKLQVCREEVERNLASSDCALTSPVVHMLLQLCLIAKEPQAYRKYRNLWDQHFSSERFLVAMDACACELEGDLVSAKSLFDSAIRDCSDYHILENALRFYKRNNFFTDCEVLFLRLQNLQIAQQTYIDNLDEFYREGISFLVAQKSASAEAFLTNAPVSELSSDTHQYMSAVFYSAINDVRHLSETLPYSGHTDFQNGIQQAICLRGMCRYDEGLELCLDLVAHTTETDKGELKKAYWLISDLYLLLDNDDDSFMWAMKAHELTRELPYDESHHALLGRAMHTGHLEGVQTVLEYQKTHPVVVNYIKEFRIPSDDKNVGQKLLEQLREYLPEDPDSCQREREIAAQYKRIPVSIHLLLEHYGGDWRSLLEFARQNKLRLGAGDLERQQLELSWVETDITIDAETLAILAFCGCLSALDAVEHIHISYRSVFTLQNYYLCNRPKSMAIGKLMKWLHSSSSVVLEPDGMICADDVLAKVFSPEFFASCNIAEKHNIPFVCADASAVLLQAIPGIPISTSVRFVTIPSFVDVYKQSQPELGNQMVYRLLEVGSFVPFTADTILEQIRLRQFRVSKEWMQPFLICRTDYNMMGFANVYLQAAAKLCEQNAGAAKGLLTLLLDDTARIWKRGTYYRETSIRMRDRDSIARADAIARYVVTMIAGAKQIWNDPPANISTLCDGLQYEVEQWVVQRPM